MENKEKTEGKRPYEKPAMEIIELSEPTQLLAGSAGSATHGDYNSKEW